MFFLLSLSPSLFLSLVLFRSLLLFQAFAIVDPVSPAAQRLSPLLLTLRDDLHVSLRLFFAPHSGLSDLPIKRFYRYVLRSAVTFATNGQLRVRQPFRPLPSLPSSHFLSVFITVPPFLRFSRLCSFPGFAFPFLLAVCPPPPTLFFILLVIPLPFSSLRICTATLTFPAGM